MGYGSSYRGGAIIKLVCLHTTEGSRTKESLSSFFWNNPNASSHSTVDHTGILDMVPRELAAWTLGGGNSISVNLEICGFAKWTREQWLSTGTVDGCVNPRMRVYWAAVWAKRECEALGIPKRLLAVGDRSAGIVDHYRANRTYGWGDHHNVGAGFPWDVFFADMGTVSLPDEKKEDDDNMIYTQRCPVTEGYGVESLPVPTVSGSEAVQADGGAWVRLFSPSVDAKVWALYAVMSPTNARLLVGPGKLPGQETGVAPAPLGRDVLAIYRLPKGCIGVTLYYTAGKRQDGVGVPMQLMVETAKHRESDPVATPS